MRALVISLATTAGAMAALLYGCDRLENPQREYVAITDEVYLGGWVEHPGGWLTLSTGA